MECADEDTLAAMLAGALSEAERAEIAVHAASCNRCHALIDGLVPTTDGGTKAAPAKLAPGERVGRYEIEARLGAGGMGVVYAAIDTELQRKVALKLMRRDEAAGMGTQGRERLMREARLLAALSDPHVVTVFDVGTHEDRVFIAMELVDGGSLTSWMSRQERTTNEIVDRMIEAGRGLASAHARGVVHRDVKPDNILVGLDGRARMTDFGLARVGDDADFVAPRVAMLSPDLTATGALMGTPVYMAPEQWRKGAAEARTDQWSFCATLYELVAGVRPFPSDDANKRLVEIEAGRITPPRPERTVPTWLRKIVMRGLRANPADRWESMDVVVAALVRGRNRRRRIVQAGAAVAVVAIVGVSVGIAMTRKAPVQVTREAVGMVADDMRPGCNCPFSTCDEGVCHGVCKVSDFDYKHHRSVPGLDVKNEQEALVGLTNDGDALLYLTGKACVLDHLMIAYRHGDTYVPTDLTPQLDLTRLEIFEGCCTLAPDGKSVIVSWRDRRGYDRIALSGTALGAIDRDELANLRPDSAPEVTLAFPAISNDGLRFYTAVFDASAGPGEPGPHSGAHTASRTDRSVPFGPGQRIPGPARTYGRVTAESIDGLTLFSDTEYGTAVLARTTLSERFMNVLPNLAAPRVVGLRTYPVGDCSRVATTYTPGGCRNEQIVWLDGVHRPPVIPLSSAGK